MSKQSDAVTLPSPPGTAGKRTRSAGAASTAGEAPSAPPMRSFERPTQAFKSSINNLRFADLEVPAEDMPARPAPPPVKVVHQEKESTVEFIEKKREMFLLEYALSVKREEIRRLEQQTEEREKAIAAAERAMEEEATRFDALTKEYTLKAMEATKKAEAETKTKLERQTELKKLNVSIATLRSEIAKYDERLEDCRRYKEFLDGLTPPDWLARHSQQTAERKPGAPADDEMFFKDPDQLMQIFKALEKRNMFLINHNQDTERVLEDLKQKRRELEQKMDRECAALQAQKAKLEEAIEHERGHQKLIEQRAAKREGLGEASEQDEQLAQLHAKVEEVYTLIVGENSAGMSTLQMLTSIERRMEELFQQKDSLPQEYVKEAEKLKDKARRQKVRDEQLQRQQEEQQNKIRRAVERSQRPVVKRKGKPEMFRSYLPPKVDKRAIEEQRTREEEEADLDYFGLSQAPMAAAAAASQNAVATDSQKAK
eukprot:m51a1_g4301 hypothetical protein (484) ;mRNA; f:12217-13992